MSKCITVDKRIYNSCGNKSTDQNKTQDREGRKSISNCSNSHTLYMRFQQHVRILLFQKSIFKWAHHKRYDGEEFYMKVFLVPLLDSRIYCKNIWTIHQSSYGKKPIRFDSEICVRKN